MKKIGLPKEVLSELDITQKKQVVEKEIVTAIVERHQVKLPVPSKLRKELEFRKGQKVSVTYDPKLGVLVYEI